jgi:dipeptidyl aminopeptidase/acylaminoacyl peptidase
MTVSQATVLDEKMKSVGASHTLTVFKGQGHGFADEYRTREHDAMWAFIEQHLKP